MQAAGLEAADGYSYPYTVRSDRLIVEQEGSVAVSGPRRRIERRTDGVAIVTTWPDSSRCFSFDVQRRTFWECSEAAAPASPGPLPEVSRLTVREIPPPEDAAGGAAGLKRRARLLSCRLTTPLPGGAKNPAARFLKAYVADLSVELVVSEVEAPGLVVPWRLHANLFGQHLAPVEDALAAFLASREGRPVRLRVRTTRTAEGGTAVRDEVEVVFGEFRPLPADPAFFEVPRGYRHEKPVVGIPAL